MRQIQTLQSFLHGKAASVQAHAAYNILSMQEKLLSADKQTPQKLWDRVLKVCPSVGTVVSGQF